MIVTSLFLQARDFVVEIYAVLDYVQKVARIKPLVIAVEEELTGFYRLNGRSSDLIQSGHVSCSCGKIVC